MKTLEKMPLGEYETVIERFIEEAARWDGSLPVETFFDAWATLENRQEQVEIQAQIKGDRLVLVAPPDSSLRVQDNRIWFQDGRQVVIHLVAAPMAATG